MVDDNWYLRNRSRDLLVDLFRVARQVQLLIGFKTSQVLKILASVYRETDGNLVNVHLFYVIREIERDERRGV